MLFIDRFDAALKMLPSLRGYRNEDAIVYAIPGGGVPIGYYLSKDYNFPMQLLITKKIEHPKSKGLSIGAVSLGDRFIDERLNVPESYIRNEVTRIRKSLRDRYTKLMEEHPSIDARGKVVIIVDDGVASGNTILSAIRMMRSKRPKKIIVAVPLAPYEAAARIEKEADDFICLHTIKNSASVGLNYINYSKVTDKEIHQLLKATNRLDRAA